MAGKPPVDADRTFVVRCRCDLVYIQPQLIAFRFPGFALAEEEDVNHDIRTSVAAEAALAPVWARLDAIAHHNTTKVLDAFQAEMVGDHHFAGTTGYGHDDLGREVLEKVFARVFKAEAALVRQQFASGTHAISTALFGVLKPGDELLYVTGHPYDTLEEVIGLRGENQGSLLEWGVKYRECELGEEPELTVERWIAS